MELLFCVLSFALGFLACRAIRQSEDARQVEREINARLSGINDEWDFK